MPTLSGYASLHQRAMRVVRGRFDARRFETAFGGRSTVDRNGDKAFTVTELTRMISANSRTATGYLAATPRRREA
jgi:hypothetical protein